ncbi:glycoside hydrolase family 76 protein [Mucilaginibacter myungsuensis]|uniref:Glycoside hydrolase family 76 n=1 Tax=Mucilaginibacter myungsuensis TaxID=649104 RepID=A0A929KU40_9SPHI|nr:glycoside hydrolase family 76 protein [Mucilaginibacter myungsuensis]MBE9661584.1 glycoside hydrolase family 76 [Mucilaginibacter myungsuensis]MDN3597729.1 glycoside hydrolase family 76 protein [Mucilaginibacter myungsuensis]
MMTNKIKGLGLVLFLSAMTGIASAQNTKGGVYTAALYAFDAAIQKNFYDKASNRYFVVLDPKERETKNGYLREYTYLWSYCALYQAANEMEKLNPKANLMEPIKKQMEEYWDPAPPVAGYSDYIMKLKPGQRYYDDNEWIGISALDSYVRTKKKSDLKLGKDMYDFILSGYDQVLGGGIYWVEGDKGSKNTCSNGPGALVALQLYQITKQKAYLDTAIKIVAWTDSKLRTPENLYWDNISTKAGNRIGKATFSYNTGTMLESYVYLYELTKDKKYLEQANIIADASLPFFYGKDKFRDGYWFNAVLLRGYQHLLKFNKDTKYIMGFKKCLDYALANEKHELGVFKTDKGGTQNLVEQGGMLEILARYAQMEQQGLLK